MRIAYAEYFLADVELQQDWYTEQSDAALGIRYADAVLASLKNLAANPHLGIQCNFRSRKLRGLRRFLVDRPFHTHLIFYRVEEQDLVAVRVISGFRDLQRRLLQPPGAD